jgi:two-component system, LytTR family, response regulator
MTALRVVSVDDEPLARERVSELVRETEGLQLVGEGRNGLEALDLITTLKPDLVFIDVEMPELSGFGVIAAIEGHEIPGVVFVTAFERYALKAFDVGAIDYLHKPVTKKRFAAAVARSRERLAGGRGTSQRAVAAGAAQLERERGVRTRFVVRQGNAHHFVPVDHVDWIDAADNYLQLHVGDRMHLCRGTLNDVAEELAPSQFVRIHRSALVAVNRIATIRPRESGGHLIELTTGARLKASRGYADRVRALLR